MIKKVVYVATDGREFTNPDVCRNYEDFLEFQKDILDSQIKDIDKICKYIWADYILVKRG